MGQIERLAAFPFSPQEWRGVESWPSPAQQGGDDERGREAVPPSPWRGGERFQSNAAGESGEGGERQEGETQPDHWSEPWSLPLRAGRLEVIIRRDFVTCGFLMYISCVISLLAPALIPCTTFFCQGVWCRNTLKDGCLISSQSTNDWPWCSRGGEGRRWISVTSLIWWASIQLFGLSHECWRRLCHLPASDTWLYNLQEHKNVFFLILC